MWMILKVFIELVTIVLLFCVVDSHPPTTPPPPRAFWDLNFPIRHQTHTPCIGGEVLTSGPPWTSQT